ncbi:hypothetical protein AeNC1_000014 [Aphanomyces euteiches]|nr:hypothetical protein AeNC1_000014 [Aphanomyces euteiches]
MGCNSSTARPLAAVAADASLVREEVVATVDPARPQSPNRATITTEFVKHIVKDDLASMSVDESIVQPDASLKIGSDMNRVETPPNSTTENRRDERPPTPRVIHRPPSGGRGRGRGQLIIPVAHSPPPGRGGGSFVAIETRKPIESPRQSNTTNPSKRDMVPLWRRANEAELDSLMNISQIENVESVADDASDSCGSDDAATDWLATSSAAIQATKDDDESESDGGVDEVHNWLETSKKVTSVADETSPPTITTHEKSTVDGTISIKRSNPTMTSSPDTIPKPPSFKPKLLVRQVSAGIPTQPVPASPTQPAGIRDTTVVKKKKAELPTHNLPHPKPISGDWLNSRTMINNYIILETLGAGSYAEVKLCKEKATGQLFAMKFIDRDIMHKHSKLGKQTDNLMDIKREIAIMKKLNHPNVLRLYEVMDDPHMNKLFLVLEYMQLGDLLSFKKSQKKHSGVAPPSDTICEPMSDRELHGVALQVLLGLIYLHEQNIVHGDLKPQNLLIGERGIVKIADFGISQNLYGSKQKLLEAMGTPAFMSPEMCSGAQYSGQLADVWAFGATLFMLKFGNPPFVAKSALQVFDRIQNDPLVFPSPIDPALADILSGILTKDPTKRLGLHEVMIHPWITKERAPLDRRLRPPQLRPSATSVPITVSVDEINSAIHESPTPSTPHSPPFGPPLSPYTPQRMSPHPSHLHHKLEPVDTRPPSPKRCPELHALHEQGSNRRRLTLPSSKRKLTLTSEETDYRSERFAQKRSHQKLVATSGNHDTEASTDDVVDDDDILDQDDAEAIYQSANGLDELLLTTLAPTSHTVLHKVPSDDSAPHDASQSLLEPANNALLGISIGVSSMQGRRSTQEDRWIIMPDVQAIFEANKHADASFGTKMAYVGLYDGHGGDACASLLKERLHIELFHRVGFIQPNLSTIAPAIQQTCLDLDAGICDELYALDSPSGSTATFCVIDGTSAKPRLVVGHVGDCRALLCRKGRRGFVPLTKDHRCSTQDEHDRVVSTGGVVINNRINGVLGITRTFGDLEFKGRELKATQQAAAVYSQECVGTVLHALPDVVIVDIHPMDEFLLLACDGVWEVMSNDAAVEFVSERLAVHGNIHVAADELAHEALRLMSSDNVTVLLVHLNISKQTTSTLKTNKTNI